MTLATQLADAALKIARANHYLVGFDPHATEGISLQDFQDAHVFLINRELADMRARCSEKPAQVFDLAFSVLSTACYHRYNVNM